MSFFRHLPIKVKLIILVLFAGVFMTGIGIVGYFYMMNMAANSEEMYNQNLIPIGWIEQVQINNETLAATTLEMIANHDEELESTLSGRMKRLLQENDVRFSMFEKSQMDDNMRKMVESYKAAVAAYLPENDKLLELAADHKQQEAYDLYRSKVQQLRAQVNDKLTTLADYARTTAKRLNEDTLQSVGQAQMAMTAANVIVLLGLAVLGWQMSRMITLPLGQLQKCMAQAERGDLSVAGTYRSKDEIGRLTNDFNSMVGGLRELIRGVSTHAISLSSSAEQLSASTGQTSEATHQIASSIQEVSHGADLQLRSVEEGVQAMEEIAIGIERVAQSAVTAAHTSKEANAEAAYGNETIRKVMEQMQRIQLTVDQSAGMTRQLGDKSQQIGQIVETIAEISAQTNLLALNAAIEAARAGEHGRGFSVVADEVRKLAEQSQVSADSIAGLVDVIRHEMNAAVTAMDKGYAEVSEGMSVVKEAGAAFEKITQRVDQVAMQMEEVSSASEQMAASTRQFADSVNYIEQIARGSLANAHAVAASSQEQLAAMEEVAASTESLNQMAQELHELTGRFKV
ncbi:methyl-accepting chemotaxis protein [Brevibacillus fluminis]|uniref:methyl-accepting chemotaxis protein n=1 Tax=Brevibacillus fluminis TaxID=511487 RepID=UPI003F893C7D